MSTWSTQDIQLLRQLAGAGESLQAIAVRLRRTCSAIRNKATMQGISLKGGGDTRLPSALSRWGT